MAGITAIDSLFNDLSLNEYDEEEEYERSYTYLRSTLKNRKLSEILHIDLGTYDKDMCIILGYYLLYNKDLETLYECYLNRDLHFLGYSDKLKLFSFIDKWSMSNL